MPDFLQDFIGSFVGGLLGFYLMKSLWWDEELSSMKFKIGRMEKTVEYYEQEIRKQLRELAEQLNYEWFSEPYKQGWRKKKHEPKR